MAENKIQENTENWVSPLREDDPVIQLCNRAENSSRNLYEMMVRMEVLVPVIEEKTHIKLDYSIETWNLYREFLHDLFTRLHLMEAIWRLKKLSVADWHQLISGEQVPDVLSLEGLDAIYLRIDYAIKFVREVVDATISAMEEGLLPDQRGKSA